MPTPKCAMKCGTVFDKSYKGTIHASNGRFVCDSCYNELSGAVALGSKPVKLDEKPKVVEKVSKPVESLKAESSSKVEKEVDVPVGNVEELKKEFEDGESSLF